MTVSAADLGVLARQEVSMRVDQKFAPMVELGATGLRRTAGYVDDEFLTQLRGRRAVQVYREMADNDPIVGALVFAIDKLLRQVDWAVEAASQSDEDKRAAEFLEQCRDDMSHSWSDFITEALTMIVYGWSWHEIVYKRRVGPWETDPKRRSQYTDGLIGWRKMPIRSQETLLNWSFDATGGIQGMIQMAPPFYNRVPLPISKSLLFRVTPNKGNPEGRSLLRNAYRPWFLKKRLEEIEAIGVERDLAGLPVGKLPHDYLKANATPEMKAMVDAFKKLVRSVRRDEQEGIILPQLFDPDTKQPLFDFSLLNSGGSRQFDTGGIIQRYEQRILMSVLSDFIMVGHESVGSYSLHTDKTGLFRTAINSIADSIADVLNRHAVPKLFAINGWKPDELPKFRPSDVDPPDLIQLANFMVSMAQVGVQWFPDPELEKFLRQTARLPELDPTAEKVREVEYDQGNIMRLAQQHLQAMQMTQQAESGQLQITQQRASTAQAQLQAQYAPTQMQLQDEQARTGLAQQKMQADPEYQAQMTQAQIASEQAKAKADQQTKADSHAQQLQHRQELHQLMLRHAKEKAAVGSKQAKDKAAQDIALRRQRAAELARLSKQPPKKGPKK